MSTTKTPRPGRRAPLDHHKLKRIRESKGRSQQDLAELSGLSTTHISRLEMGRGGVSANGLAALANALECQVTDLMPDESADETATDVDVPRLRSAERTVPDEVLEVRR